MESDEFEVDNCRSMIRLITLPLQATTARMTLNLGTEQLTSQGVAESFASRTIVARQRFVCYFS